MIFRSLVLNAPVRHSTFVLGLFFKSVKPANCPLAGGSIPFRTCPICRRGGFKIKVFYLFWRLEDSNEFFKKRKNSHSSGSSSSTAGGIMELSLL
jgi:hypothetical protein